MRKCWDSVSLGRRVVLAWVVAYGAVGCRASAARPTGTAWQPPGDHASAEKEPAQRFRSLAEKRFDSALHIKPSDSGAPEVVRTMAPLFAVGVSPEISEELHWLLEPLDVTARGDASEARRVVYYEHDVIEVGGEVLQQVSFVWNYGRVQCVLESPLIRGVRVTLGADGFPLVWEVYDGHEYLRAFVSASAEAAARARFGQPTDSDRFAVQPAIAWPDDFLVVGLIEDGPIPMGPYVYIDSFGRIISSVRCRCEPSLVDSFREPSLYYDLEPLAGYGQLWTDWRAIDRRMSHRLPRLRIPAFVDALAETEESQRDK